MRVDRGRYQQEEGQERVLMVGALLPPETPEGLNESMEELRRLLETLGGDVVDTCIQKRHTPDPAFFIGKGKAESIKGMVEEKGIVLVAFDNELTGNQQGNLERAIGCRVIDRTGIILDIFSKHARTKEAKNQVEMAQLEYLSSRLTRRWTHLERQRGGIGLRGVGEKQIELDRRLIRTRLSKLKKQVRHTEQDRATQRRHRDRFLRVAIVGYTNAGKSTLMNNLTTASVLVDDRLFATLDPTVRVIDPKTRPPILLSDTVGFIKKLPHGLVESFRSTLAEVIEADLVLHVIDLSSTQYRDQMEVTRQVLDEIGAGEKPTFLVFNKCDKVDEFFLPKMMERKYVDCVAVSAFDPQDMKRLREALYSYFERDMMELELVIPYEDAWLEARIHEYSKVLEKKYLDHGTQMKIRILRTDASLLKLVDKAGLSHTRTK